MGSDRRRRLLIDVLVLSGLVFVLLVVMFGNPVHWAGELFASTTHVAPQGDTSPSTDIKEIAFRASDRRYIQVVLETHEPTVVRRVLVNGGRIFTWDAESYPVGGGAIRRVLVYYPWVVNTSYRVEVVLSDGKVWKTATAMPIPIYMGVNVSDIKVTSPSKGLAGSVDISYHINSSGYSNVSVMAFLSKYEPRERPVYVFYDTNFMPNETLERADVLVKTLGDFGFNVSRLSWIELENVANRKESCVLVIFNPLMDRNGTDVYDVLPSVITDRNRNGLIRDDSAYRKSYLYDWMLSSGMVLITPDSTQPNWNILYDDGSVKRTGDKYEWFDACLVLTPAANKIQWGYGSAGRPSSSLNIENTLQLATWNGKWGFVKSYLRNSSVEYYPYGVFHLVVSGAEYTTYLPAFVRTGEGGWLTMGDLSIQNRDSWGLKPFELSKIILHAPWNMHWMEEGWNFDSGHVVYPVGGGTLNTESKISISLPPDKVRPGRYTLRLMAIGYNNDNSTYMLIKRSEKLTII